MKNNAFATSLAQLTEWLLLALVILAPLIVIPLTLNFIVHTKLYLFFTITLLIIILFLSNSLKTKTLRLIWNPVVAALLCWGLITLISAFAHSSYPVEALLGKGGVYLSLVLLVITGSSLLKKPAVNKLINALVIAGGLLTVSSLLQFLGFGSSKLISQLTGFQLASNLSFNLAGSPLIAAQVIGLALLGIGLTIVKKRVISSLHLLLTPILIFGLALHIWAVLPGQVAALRLLPWQASWSIALDALRSPKTALIGTGPESYTNTYLKFKPLWLNSHAYWQIVFNNASNLPLTLIVNLGISGLLSWLALVYTIIRQLKTSHQLKLSKASITAWLLAASLALQLFFPGNTVLFSLQAVFLAYWLQQQQSHSKLIQLKGLAMQVVTRLTNHQDRLGKNWFMLILTTGLLLTTLALAYGLGRSYLAFYQLYQAQQAALNNNLVMTYNHHRQAVKLNPYIDGLRRSYALVNLQLAQTLANKTELTDQDKQQITQLISQAIREAKAATLLDESDSQNWTILAEVYQNIINTADGADQWTVESYVQAIKLNPKNPLLRAQLGYLFFSQEKYQQAAQLFNQTIELKPDLPLGYYQLGLTLQQLNQPQQTLNLWQQALALLPPQSEDYQVLSEQISQLEQQLDKLTTNQAQPNPTAPNPATSSQLQTTKLGQELATDSAQLPSLTEQNLNTDDQELINQPADEPLNVSPEEKPTIEESDL
ncbi:MAG: tetratricopeptide repeat protein [Candidatus Pacebacteria bacterium]|nr:tetratricopeptide repeat protein [Candidatus Paceibacterota bacterium]